MVSSATILRFFFQAEDGIRDTSVTGVQTCALPICAMDFDSADDHHAGGGIYRALGVWLAGHCRSFREIGRASCRERV